MNQQPMLAVQKAIQLKAEQKAKGQEREKESEIEREKAGEGDVINP